jgi:phage terminase small subunit
MAELKNPKHETFVQNILRGLSPTEAYISAGYSGKGAHTSAARLLKNPQVCTRLAELRKAVEPILEEAIVKLIVTERLERLVAIQDRWDRVRTAINARAREDYPAMMATGVVIRKERSIRDGRDSRVVFDYEIDTSAIEALNSIEKRAAIETGQEVDRADINLRGGVAAQAEMLRKAFTLEELEAMDARLEAARNGTKVLGAPAVVVPEVQPFLDKTEGRSGVAAAEAVDQADREGMWDPAGDGRTGRGTGPGQDGVVASEG